MKGRFFLPTLTIIILFASSVNAHPTEVQHLKKLTYNWNQNLMHADFESLANLYSHRVMLYGVSFSKAMAISNKETFYKNHPDFTQSITSEILAKKLSDKTYSLSFEKQSSYSGKVSRVQAYLIFEKTGDTWKITSESDEVSDKNIAAKKDKKDADRKIGRNITGDFDGDGKKEKTNLTLIKEGKFDEVGYVLSIDFLSPSIKPMTFTCDQDWIVMINEGDLNGVVGDEMTIYAPPNHGCIYNMTTYTYAEGEWKQIMDSFLIPTFCDVLSDEELQQKIFKEGKVIYFLETDFADEDFKSIKKVAKLY